MIRRTDETNDAIHLKYAADARLSEGLEPTSNVLRKEKIQ